jgi:DNA-binding PucR family transcriptional regulator
MRYQSEDGTADGEDAGSQLNTEYWLETRLRRLKTKMHMPKTRIGVVSHENMHLLIINNGTPDMHQRIQEIIQEIYLDKLTSRRIFIGVGIEVVGLSALGKSYNRAVTAMRMAVYQDKPVIRFEEMGFYKILFSVKDDEVLYAYADEMLAPLDAYDAKNHNYIEFLQAYIQNDRSLEHTAKSLFLHRNTVNYRLQKMKELLHSPLKTVEDLFPYQVALAIRDMQNQRILLGSQNEEQTGGTKE